MNKEEIFKIVQEYIISSNNNYISAEDAITEDLVGMRMFDEPVIAFGSANDEKFSLLKNPEAVGEHFILPKEWLPQAETVISYFLPFTDEVIKSNRLDKKWPSNEWLHCRIEGQNFIKESASI